MANKKLTGAKKAATQLGISVEQYLQNVNSGLKWCFRCKSFISRDFFSNAADKSDGKHSQCKKCEQACARRRYKPILPQEKKKSRSFGVQLPRDGDKRQARRSVHTEVAKGKLPHANTVACTDCGHLGCDRRHEYDHYLGYAGRHHLEVQCVCTSCHHRRERQRRKGVLVLGENKNPVEDVSQEELAQLLAWLEQFPRPKLRTVLREVVDRLGKETIANLLE